MSMSIILAILMIVETGGQKHPETAVGDNGRAIGVLQIHREVVSDVNRIYGTHYVWPTDCRNIEKSKDIATKYLTIHAKGRTPEQTARIWNGGPSGWKKKATAGYGRKFNEIAKKKGARHD